MNTEFPHGNSVMAQAVRSHDWAASPLGPTAQWPSPLRNAVDLMLGSPESMYVVWGDALTFFYNDAYTPILGPRQAQALGAPLRVLWADAWEAVREPIEAAFVGQASRFEEVPIGMNRYGVPEQTWWTFSFSPIYLDDGRVGGAFCVTNEVTARKLAQARLADEHERLIRLFEQAPMFMAFLSGPQHRVEFANPCYSRLIGHRDVIGRPLAEALPDAVEQGHVRRLDEVYRSGRAFSANALPYNVQAVPGGPTERRLLDLVYQPIAGADGTISGIFVQGLDITDRISLERAVREAEVRNRQILDSVMDYAIIATDMHGRVTSWNEGARRILGWSEAEMLGETLQRTFTPEDVEQRQMLIEAAAALESGSGMDERWHVRKSGERFWANGSLMVLREETGEAIGFVKVLRDRTAERLASEALQKSERRLDALVRASSQSIFSASAHWRDLRQLVGDGVLSDAVSATPDWQAMVHPDDRARLAQALAQATAAKSGVDVEYRVLGADGQVGWTLMRAIPLLDEREQIAEWFGTSADITDKRVAEEQLRQLTETLEERARTQRGVVAGRREAASKPKDGGGGAADRRAGARFQQSAHRHQCRPGTAADAHRTGQVRPAGALCGNGAIQRGARHRTDPAAAGVFAPADVGAHRTGCGGAGARHARHHCAHAGTVDRAAAASGGPGVAGAGGCAAAGKRAAQSLHQRARCHARWWAAHHQSAQPRAGCRRCPAAGSAAWRLRVPERAGHRNRHDCRSHVQGVRTVFHHQAHRPGHRVGPVDDLWVHPPIRRACTHRFGGGCRHHHGLVPAALHRRAGAGRGGTCGCAAAAQCCAQSHGAVGGGRDRDSCLDLRSAHRGRLPGDRNRRGQCGGGALALARAHRCAGDRRRPHRRPQRAPGCRCRAAIASCTAGAVRHRLCGQCRGERGPAGRWHGGVDQALPGHRAGAAGGAIAGAARALIGAGAAGRRLHRHRGLQHACRGEHGATMLHACAVGPA
ncbi:hypothetical protein XAP412_230114 [Xanthomonas phaseoli pv. phaseoli]|uniref:PAS domain S-box protein n=2 Tax=Xanthomonas TaxID=338 RepID=A0AB38DYS4_XANCH|nr:hypothetical protein XAP6984_300112 [Xanthomonas phaseoli pv. phaseoli]SON81991.1 hypothetical protein XAP412_230114 [Xanthomonas phaseoli pv. phaseoli]SON86120.1 hypothetical protein XAP7430_250114 [Xanthomonas phaseoli pv. phaseoli]